jgi:hypothetical protein
MNPPSVLGNNSADLALITGLKVQFWRCIMVCIHRGINSIQFNYMIVITNEQTSRQACLVLSLDMMNDIQVENMLCMITSMPSFVSLWHKSHHPTNEAHHSTDLLFILTTR